jgi:protein-L-isoaspartate O-methyltransferase
MPHGCFVVTDFGLQARSDIRELLAAHDHRPQKSFGQNFLADPNIVDRIVRTAGVDESTNVIEIGAGTGALTTAGSAKRHGQFR